MIYRLRRRSTARCSGNIAESSRLNLTQRTKSFLRSNFVSPPPSSSIKCLNSQRVEAKGIAGSSNANKPANVGVCSGANGVSENGDRVGRATKMVANNKSNHERSQLSTFGNANLSRGQLDCDLDMDKMAASDNSDIRTLNTRIAKPSYLKSLISSSGTKRQNTNTNTNTNNGNGNNCEACTDQASCSTLAQQHPVPKYSELAGCEPADSERTHSRPNPMGSKTIRLGQSQKLASVNGKARMQTIRSIDQNCDRFVEN